MRSPSVPGVPSAPLRLAISNYAHNQARRAVDRAAPYRGNSFVVVVSSLTCLRFERTLRLFAQAFITSVRLLCEREVPLTHRPPPSVYWRCILRRVLITRRYIFRVRG